MQEFDTSTYLFAPLTQSPDELETLSRRHAFIIQVLPLASGNWAVLDAFKLRFICQEGEVLGAVKRLEAEILTRRQAEASRIAQAQTKPKSPEWANLSLEDLGL